MLKKSFVVLIVMSGLVLFLIPAWGLDFEPGMYEITSKVEMPGMPAGAVSPQTISQCLTKQDPVPNKNASGQTCEIKDMNHDGNTITWKMECDQQGQRMTSEGQMSYNGNSFEGTMTINMGSQAGNMTLTTRISGKRTGDCL